MKRKLALYKKKNGEKIKYKKQFLRSGKKRGERKYNIKNLHQQKKNLNREREKEGEGKWFLFYRT